MTRAVTGAGHNRDMTDTGNRARKTSSTQGIQFKVTKSIHASMSLAQLSNFLYPDSCRTKTRRNEYLTNMITDRVSSLVNTLFLANKAQY